MADRRFIGDGCTHAPDLNVRTCCDDHDYEYTFGMTADGELITRSQADAKLRDCMRSKGWLLMPWVYYVGVRLFGGRHWIGGK